MNKREEEEEEEGKQREIPTVRIHGAIYIYRKESTNLKIKTNKVSNMMSSDYSK